MNEVLGSKILHKYAERFAGFRKKRWYTEWYIELYEFLEEIREAEIKEEKGIQGANK